MNFLSRRRTFFDESALVSDPDSARQGECLELSHVPSQSSRIPIPRGMLSRDSGLPHWTRNSMGTSGNVLKVHLLQKEYLRPKPGIAMRHGEGLKREPQSSTRPTPRCTRNLDTWNPMHRTGGTYSQNCMIEAPKFAFSELHFGTFQDFS